jgi:hypothetical protein
MIELKKHATSAPMAGRMSRLWKIKMLRALVVLLIPSLVIPSQALSQSFEQFERASQFERAMAAVDRIRGRKKLQCLISVGNRSLCECLSTRLPFTLHVSNYVSIANQDKGAADYRQLSSADMQTVDQCVAEQKQ